MSAKIVKRIMQNKVLEKKGTQKVAFYMGGKTLVSKLYIFSF